MFESITIFFYMLVVVAGIFGIGIFATAKGTSKTAKDVKTMAHNSATARYSELCLSKDIEWAFRSFCTDKEAWDFIVDLLKDDLQAIFGPNYKEKFTRLPYESGSILFTDTPMPENVNNCRWAYVLLLSHLGKLDGNFFYNGQDLDIVSGSKQEDVLTRYEIFQRVQYNVRAAGHDLTLKLTDTAHRREGNKDPYQGRRIIPDFRP